MSTSRRVLFLVASSRPGGNTELLAARAAAALPPDVHTEWVRLADVALPPFEDRRHGDGVFPEPEGAAARLLEQTLAATDLVFVAPTYWYSLPAPAKLYLDHWSGWMRLPGRQFRARMADKTLWALTVNSDDAGDEGSAPLLETLRLSAGYFGMRFGGAVVGHGSRPGDVLKDAPALAAAEELLVRGAERAA